jgi:hypothetical protein
MPPLFVVAVSVLVGIVSFASVLVAFWPRPQVSRREYVGPPVLTRGSAASLERFAYLAEEMEIAREHVIHERAVASERHLPPG